jgi:hypothetical protein
VELIGPWKIKSGRRKEMLCRHRKILFEWLQNPVDGKKYRVACQHCEQKFEVFWIDHGEPGPETNWEDGAVIGIEIGEALND